MPMSSCVAGVVPLARAACDAPGEFACTLFVRPCATLNTTGYLQRRLLDPTKYIDFFDEPGMLHRNSL